MIDSGQNPMIAYIAKISFILPVFALFSMEQIIKVNDPLTGLLNGLVYTLLVAIIAVAVVFKYMVPDRLPTNIAHTVGHGFTVPVGPAIFEKDTPSLPTIIRICSR